MELQSMTLCYLRKLEHRFRFGKSHTTKSGLAFLVQGHLNPVFPVPFGASLTGGPADCSPMVVGTPPFALYDLRGPT